MNYIASLIEHLKADVDIQVYTSDVSFLTVPKDLASPISIVFNEGQQDNEWFDKIGENGLETFPILIDIVCIRSETWRGRQLRQLLIKKLNGETELGVLKKRYGNINWVNHLPCEYDKESQRTVWGSQYMIQQTFSI